MTHRPTDETKAQVFALSSFGVTQDDIGKFIGISDDTLRKHYSSELERASTDRNADVAAFLFRSANGSTIPEGASYSDCLKAAMFWLKTRAQWRETNHVDLSSSDGSMTPKPNVIEFVSPRANDESDD
jgi:hypothetical protein